MGAPSTSGSAPLVAADMLGEQGIVGPAEGQGSRAVLVGERDAEAEQEE